MRSQTCWSREHLRAARLGRQTGNRTNRSPIRYTFSVEMLSAPKRRVAIVFVGLLMLSTLWAEAEEQIGSMYVSAAFIAPWQNGVTGETYQTYVAAPGGVSWGWTVTPFCQGAMNAAE